MTSLPCFVQLGFAGSRRLFDASLDEDPALLESLHSQLQEALWREIDSMRQQFLEPHHRLCGISQVAIGGDFLFARVCREQNIPHRVFLPQPRQDFLSASGSAGDDFDEEERQFAEALLTSTHVIQERVVSASTDRHQRFEDSNLEILRACDIVVCLLRDDATQGGSGGTTHIMELGKRRGKPVLELRVGYDAENRRAIVTSSKHNYPTDGRLSESDPSACENDRGLVEPPRRIPLALPIKLEQWSPRDRLRRPQRGCVSPNE